MVLLLNREQLTNAIERAKNSDLYVRPTSLHRQYEVENRENGKKYTVDFFVRKSDGAKFGHCSCPAGERGIACKHLAASVGYHVMRELARQASSRIERTQPIA